MHVRAAEEHEQTAALCTASDSPVSLDARNIRSLCVLVCSPHHLLLVETTRSAEPVPRYKYARYSDSDSDSAAQSIQSDW